MSKIHAAVVDPTAPGHVAIHDVEAPIPARNEALVKVAAASLEPGRGALRADDGARPLHRLGPRRHSRAARG